MTERERTCGPAMNVADYAADSTPKELEAVDVDRGMEDCGAVERVHVPVRPQNCVRADAKAKWVLYHKRAGAPVE